MANRVSKAQLMNVLHEYLEDGLANNIYYAICDADDYDRKHMIGMTVGEWKKRFDDDYELVWADDTNAGFGKQGDTVYGNSDYCVICRTDYDGKRFRLWVWRESLHSDTPWVVAGMKEHEKRRADK